MFIAFLAIIVVVSFISWGIHKLVSAQYNDWARENKVNPETGLYKDYEGRYREAKTGQRITIDSNNVAVYDRDEPTPGFKVTVYRDFDEKKRWAKYNHEKKYAYKYTKSTMLWLPYPGLHGDYLADIFRDLFDKDKLYVSFQIDGYYYYKDINTGKLVRPTDKTYSSYFIKDGDFYLEMQKECMTLMNNYNRGLIADNEYMVGLDRYGRSH